LGKDYRLEILTFGETLSPATDVDQLAATARRSDLSGALADLAERHRNDRLAGVVVLSDGGDTAPQETRPARINAPVMTVGIGNADLPRDREVVNLTAGEPLLPGASIDVSVSATSNGFGKEPVELRISANGRPLEVRRVTPSAEGAPVHAVFTVSPDPNIATVYTVQIPDAPGEVAKENNIRSVLVAPQTGKRRLLVVEGAPGFEHTFLKRALSDDPGLEIDAVVRKGQNDDGRDTFYVQGAPSRMAALSNGYPSKRSELYKYDGVIFGNVEADLLHARPARAHQRFHHDARRRPAGARRPLVRSPGTRGNATRRGAADRSHRSALADHARRRGSTGRRAEHAGADDRRCAASRDEAGGDA
jgi:hypothetical protein